MATPTDTIRIGTLVGGAGAVDYISQILDHGFETFELTWGWGKNPEQQDLPKLAADLAATMGGRASIAAIGMYGNPITSADDARQWEVLIDNAHHFGTDVVCGFAGADPALAIDKHKDHVERVWIPLAERAKAKGVRLAWENCPMGGNWSSPRFNIATNADAWDLLFAWIGLDNVGLEWEPCHQMCQLIDPMPQLRQYAKRIFHVHGKDATVYWDVIRRHGLQAGKTWCYHRTPGFGDSNWTDIISELRLAGFKGAIDIEGWHDPIYRGELEMTGQVHALNFLKRCRTTFVANPVESKKQSGY